MYIAQQGVQTVAWDLLACRLHYDRATKIPHSVPWGVLISKTILIYSSCIATFTP